MLLELLSIELTWIGIDSLTANKTKQPTITDTQKPSTRPTFLWCNANKLNVPSCLSTGHKLKRKSRVKHVGCKTWTTYRSASNQFFFSFVFAILMRLTAGLCTSAHFPTSTVQRARWLSFSLWFYFDSWLLWCYSSCYSWRIWHFFNGEITRCYSGHHAAGACAVFFYMVRNCLGVEKLRQSVQICQNT